MPSTFKKIGMYLGLLILNLLPVSIIYVISFIDINTVPYVYPLLFMIIWYTFSMFLTLRAKRKYQIATADLITSLLGTLSTIAISFFVLDHTPSSVWAASVQTGFGGIETIIVTFIIFQIFDIILNSLFNGKSMEGFNMDLQIQSTRIKELEKENKQLEKRKENLIADLRLAEAS